jgi:hypothetical protein
MVEMSITEKAEKFMEVAVDVTVMDVDHHQVFQLDFHREILMRIALQNVGQRVIDIDLHADCKFTILN